MPGPVGPDWGIPPQLSTAIKGATYEPHSGGFICLGLNNVHHLALIREGGGLRWGLSENGSTLPLFLVEDNITIEVLTGGDFSQAANTVVWRGVRWNLAMQRSRRTGATIAVAIPVQDPT